MTGFADFDAGSFLAQYWQRKPLLLKQALPGFQNPLSAEELAGLALEEDVEARLVRQQDNNWQLEPGQLHEASFQGDQPWTLLVQAVDHYVPEVAALRDLLSFLPSWRFDDVMVSYATDGGGVGPHYDNYDVFLLQGEGQRCWQLGQQCEVDAELLPNDALRILSNFEPSAEYLLEPGDILYVPPGLAHWGSAVGECMTYSLGLRAPRINDMLGRWLDGVLESVQAELFYQDPPLQAATSSGEIDTAAYAKAIAMLQDTLRQASADPRWFGELLTEPRYSVAGAAEDCKLPEAVRQEPSARLAWTRAPDQQLMVFANGQSCSAAQEALPLLQALCSGSRIEANSLTGAERELLLWIYQQGCCRDD